MDAKVGYIYEMRCEKKNVKYIGETTCTVRKRFKEHCDDPKDQMHIYGKIQDWKVKKLYNVYYFKEEQLKRVEKIVTLQYQEKGERLTNKDNLMKEKVLRNKISSGGVHVLSDKFKIRKYDGRFVIRYTDNEGKRKEKSAYFGPKVSEAEAYENISKKRNYLLLEFY